MNKNLEYYITKFKIVCNVNYIFCYTDSSNCYDIEFTSIDGDGNIIREEKSESTISFADAEDQLIGKLIGGKVNE